MRRNISISMGVAKMAPQLYILDPTPTTFSLVPSVSASLLETSLGFDEVSASYCALVIFPVAGKINTFTGRELQAGSMRQWDWKSRMLE